MLVSLKDILPPALARRYGIASFNVFGWEDASAVIDAAESLGAPVILAANLDLAKFMPVEVIASMFRTLANRAKVPVCAHLDHTYELEDVLRGIDAGFSSVMFDGSQLPLDENIAGTRQVVEYARRYGVSVEAEVGSVPYSSGRDYIRSEKTNVAEAIRLTEETGVDALAVSVGNVHRLTEPGVTIDYELLTKIEAAVPIPLVIHGTSGIREEDLRCLSQTRVCKFNIGTCLRQAFGRGLREQLAADAALFDRLTLMQRVMPYVEAQARRMICSLNWPGLKTPTLQPKCV